MPCHCGVDQLNTHPAESRVRAVAQESARAIDRGVQGQSGMLAALQTRAAVRSDPRHRLVCPVTPKPASWLNPLELWFRLLAPKLLNRGNFSAGADLRATVLALIDSFNRTMPKPFRWTYQSKALAA
jgi:hypothetical protein